MKGVYTLVGMRYRKTEDMVKKLQDGASLMLRREPSNTYDINAIQVLAGGIMVGYIKRNAEQQTLAHKLDLRRVNLWPAKFVVDPSGWPHVEIDEP